VLVAAAAAAVPPTYTRLLTYCEVATGSTTQPGYNQRALTIEQVLVVVTCTSTDGRRQREAGGVTLL